jgi:hypothetical protein
MTGPTASRGRTMAVFRAGPGRGQPWAMKSEPN